MFTTITFPIRYVETDRMGIVHHSNYAVWFEIGRTDYLEQLGKTYAELEENGLWLPLSHLECSFLAPGAYPRVVAVKTALASLTCARLTFVYEVYDDSGTLLAKGKTEHGVTDENLKPYNLAKRWPGYYQLLSEKALTK